MRGLFGSCEISFRVPRDATATSMSCLAAESKSDPGETNQAKIGIRTPWARSEIASSSNATPNQSAPLFSAANPISTNPCPYASALTTAKRSTLDVAFRIEIFEARANRSIRASARCCITCAPQSPWLMRYRHREKEKGELGPHQLNQLSHRERERLAFHPLN